MDDFSIKIRIGTLLLFLLCATGVWFLPAQSEEVGSVYLQVSFLDVGQGDSIFIQTPDGAQALIDGGPNASVLHDLADVMGSFDRTLDVVIGTHPDTDHIGGLVDVLQRYKVDTLLITENDSDSATAQTYMRRVQEEGADIIFARRGQRIQLGASTTLEILFPDSDVSSVESNASSIVARLVYGDTSFLLTGDAPKRTEEYLALVEGEYLQSTVLKVGHHGSRTSSSELFLDEVMPQYAVISAEANSRYGHPHVEVTDALFNRGIETLSTAESGTITFYSDGASVWVE